MDTWKSATGFDASKNKRIRLCVGIIGYTLVFCGIAMQWWAAVRLYSIPMKKLCESYSGNEQTMTREDWAAGWDTLRESNPEAKDWPLEQLMQAAAQFTFGYQSGQGDHMANILHASPSFWCRYLPECPKASESGQLVDGFFYFDRDAVCDATQVVTPGENTHVGGWPGRLVSDVAHWNMAPQYIQGSWTDARISCGDKRRVYKEFMLELAAFSGAITEKDVDHAVANFNNKCQAEKGPIRYAIGLGPTLSAFALLFGMLSLCFGWRDDDRCSCVCTSPYLSGTAKSFLILGLAMCFIALWLGAFSVANELTSYSFCGKAGFPLTANGTLFDSTPCLDQNSKGEHEYNPYAIHTAHIEGMYSSGCITVIVGLILCMVALWKQSEQRVAERLHEILPDEDL